MKTPPKVFLHRAGREAEEVMPELRHVMSSTQLAFVYGLILGSLPEEEAHDMFRTLDSLVRLSDIPLRHTGSGCAAITRALREAGLLELPDPPKGRAKPVNAVKKRELLRAAGWFLIPKGTNVSPPNRPRFTNPKITESDRYIPDNAMHSPIYEAIFYAVTLDTAWKSYTTKKALR